MTFVAVTHNFETAHRLPHLGGKCVNLHGHSWLATLTIASPAHTDEGTVIEYGALKKLFRGFIDTNLDHATMLGMTDPLVEPLSELDQKLYVFGSDRYTDDLGWPTVENVARMLFRASHDIVESLLSDPLTSNHARVRSVEVRETAVNFATANDR